jgi:hypothetical protein
VDGDEYEYDYEDVGIITCKRCGADELEWEEARGERNQKCWVLVEANGTVHVCNLACDPNDFPLTT